MQMGWNTQCLIAGPVIYFRSLTVLTVCASNKNTETVSLAANNDLHFLSDHGKWRECLSPPQPPILFVTVAIKICFNPFPSQPDICPTIQFPSISSWKNTIYFWQTLRFSVITCGWVVDAFINSVICLWLFLLSADGFPNYILFCPLPVTPCIGITPANKQYAYRTI